MAVPAFELIRAGRRRHAPRQYDRSPKVTDAAFAQALAAAAPFEPRPHLAVAVSGGADSMALVLLADRWTRVRRGRVTALTVDHGLRTEAGAEARQVARWCRARAIAHRTLMWHPPPNLQRGDVQAAARAGRYRLMEDWCRAHAVLHLLTAHHQGDQGETFLLRLGHRSGLAGLAGMPVLREAAEVRLIRPLLGFSRAQLEAFLVNRRQDWIEDPSNRDPAYARVRLRALVPEFAAEGLDTGAQCRLAARLGHVRRGLEACVAALLAEAAAPHPAGFVRIGRSALLAAGPEVGTRALARVLGAVSGTTYPARGERLARLYDGLATGLRGRTLAGCRVLPSNDDAVLVCREANAVTPPVPAEVGVTRWDGRFRVTIGGRAGSAALGSAMLGALGEDGWAALARVAPDLRESDPARAVPLAARITLPALWDAHGLLEVPYFGYRRSGKAAATLSIVDVRPDVPEPLAGPRFSPAPGSL